MCIASYAYHWVRAFAVVDAVSIKQSIETHAHTHTHTHTYVYIYL